MQTRKRESVSVPLRHSYTEGSFLDSHPGLMFAESCLLGGAGRCKVNNLGNFTDQTEVLFQARSRGLVCLEELKAFPGRDPHMQMSN